MSPFLPTTIIQSEKKPQSQIETIIDRLLKMYLFWWGMMFSAAFVMMNVTHKEKKKTEEQTHPVEMEKEYYLFGNGDFFTPIKGFWKWPLNTKHTCQIHPPNK